MSVAAMNKFALLNDDEGDSAPATKQQASKTKAAGADTAKKTDAAAPTKGPASRTGNYYPRGGGRPPRNQDRDSAPAGAPAEEPTSGARFDRTENRGDRGGRGRGRGRGGARGGGRMDRHSRTDITDSDKQVNQGWGDNTKEVVAEQEGEADAKAEAEAPVAAPGNEWGAAPAADWGAGGDAAEGGETPAAKEGGDSRPPRPVEEEDNTITFAEYQKNKNSGLADLVGSVEAREANEGNADLFKNAEKLNKETDVSYFQGAQKSKTSKPKEKKAKETIEIDGTFAEPAGSFRGGRGGRGFRGGDRGGERGGHHERGGHERGGHNERGSHERGGHHDRGERGGYGGRGRGGGGDRGDRRGRGAPRHQGQRAGGGANINVDDESAFPSL